MDMQDLTKKITIEDYIGKYLKPVMDGISDGLSKIPHEGDEPAPNPNELKEAISKSQDIFVELIKEKNPDQEAFTLMDYALMSQEYQEEINQRIADEFQVDLSNV